MKKPIDFYFDFSSPYGYFAATRIAELAARYDRTVQWHPILLGAVFKVTGAAALPLVPLKGEYSLHDFVRSARFHGIAYQHPAEFPLATQRTARAMLWLQQHHSAEKAVAFCLAVFHAYFVDGLHIGQADVLAHIAETLDIDGQALVAGSENTIIKEKLKTEIEVAIVHGVFGSPFIVADDEPFWGFDRFDQLEAYLKNGKI